ncbi:MAG TPA: carboxylesterase family protein [Rhizomicrobium sp.]|nr:carboxylesterase family protein [Rhizomicrobium sp.]
MIRRLIFSICAAVCLAAPSLAAPVVDAPAGQMRGQAEGAMHVFKGIPYALPPVGPARWKPPAPMPRWQVVKNTTAYGPACLQPVSHVPNIYSADLGAMSEDCLTLNIWAPADAHNAPVFFWIHGGALVGGAGKDALYDGARLAARGVVVVTINYRLGVLGWLAHPELSAESPLHISGNYGLLDQIEALRWVKRNIGAFGGDASNVTIAGESAGGLSVMYLLASPEARGLFAKAIAESAYMVTVPTLKAGKYGEPSAEASGVQLATALHAPNIAALRAMDAAALANAAPAAGFLPLGAVDGHILPDQLVDIFDKGEQAHVPLLAGFNAGEIRSLRVLAPPPPASAAVYESTIRDRYKDLADDFLKLYPSSNMQESIWATTRDALYGWTAERLARKQTAIGQPAFLYLFDHGYPAADDGGYHAFHGSELPFVFGTVDRTPPMWPKIPATPGETKLTDAMVGYWTSFARSGRPQAAGEPDWPAYDATAAYMAFRDAPHPSDHLMPGMYTLDEQVVCRRHASGDEPWHWNVGLASPPLPPKASCP